MNIEYKLNKNITTNEFIDVLKNSTLADRRPIDDLETIKGMIENADIIVTATIDDKIILLSAPNAIKYYPKIGFTKHNSAWTLAKDNKLS